MSKTHKTSRLRKAVYSALVVILVLGLTEVGVRLLWEEPVIDGILAPDPIQRWNLPRSGSIRLAEVTIETNSLRYRGPEVEPDPDPCTYRIYAAGDSSVFGHGIPYGQAYVELLPTLVTAPGGLQLEGINGGVPGYSTFQSSQRLRRTGWALQPDLLIIANLWSDSAHAGIADRELFVDDGWIDRATWIAIAEHLSVSRLFRLIYKQFEFSSKVFSTGDPSAAIARVSLDEYRDNLTLMVSEARERDVPLILLLLPHPGDQLETLSGDERDLVNQGQDEVSHDYRQTMRSVASRTDTLLVDMSEIVADRQEPLFLDDVHPNLDGHRLIAEVLADEIQTHTELFEAATARCR